MLLLLVSKDFKTSKKVELEDMYIFPGRSCFPLTPKDESEESKSKMVSHDDQLVKILSLLGKQDESNLSFVKEEKVVGYIKKLSKEIGDNTFEDKFPGISPKLLDMLKALLKFNPEDRASV